MEKIDKIEYMVSMKDQYEMDMKKINRVFLYMAGITWPILITIVALARHYA